MGSTGVVTGLGVGIEERDFDAFVAREHHTQEETGGASARNDYLWPISSALVAIAELRT